MGKEVIHVEVDEDIAGVIGRVKRADEKVVAVVAPKNLGALRSAMNLKLLRKAAKSADKVIAVISDNPAMVNLAGVAGVALAPNLETKPEVPEVGQMEEGHLVAEELMAGEPLTINGELETGSSLGVLSPGSSPSPSFSDEKPGGGVPTGHYPSLDGDAVSEEPGKGEPMNGPTEKKRKFTALTAKVDKVWQKALIIGGIVVGAVAIGVLVLFLAIKPVATVNIATHMDTIDVRREVRFKTNDNNVEGGIFQLSEKSLGVEQTEEFEATGEKVEGDRATGEVVFKNCTGLTYRIEPSDTFTVDGKRYSIPAGTSVEIPGVSSPCGADLAGASERRFTVVAMDIGEEFNLASGVVMAFRGDSVNTRAVSQGLTGGSRRTVRVVSEGDVQNALGRMDAASIEEGRSRLKASLDAGLYAFDLTFVAESGVVEVTPKVGEVIGNGARATVKRTQNYRIMTAVKEDMERFARELAETQAAGKKIYEIGSFDGGDLFLERVEIVRQTGGTTCEPEAAGCVPSAGTVQEMTALLKTVARAGDDISEEAISEAVAGERVNDANRLVMEFSGVQRVDIKLGPFWANRIPNDLSRIKINIQADN
ncbi:hypothetical protein FWG86_00100 [Candidatus Saccharibacteria bacterium]|nr:hypothetical protein [Candidatus Saccharibacteria bacterium]